MNTSRRAFGGLLAATGISVLGTSMSFLAIPWFVLARTGSTTTMGLAAFAEMLPYVLVQALGGPVVDRLGPLRVSVLTDLAAALAMGAIPLAHAAGALSLPLLMAAVGIAGASRGAGDVARRVLLPRISPIPLERASGFCDGIHRLAGLLGAPLAGLLVAASSAPAVIALDAASFALSALLVALLVHRPDAAAPPRTASYLADLRDGLAYLRRDRLLLGIGAMVLVTNLLDQAYASVLLPVWVRRELGSPIALGALSAAFGLGAVGGNLLMAWLGPGLPRRLPFALSFLVCGAPRFLVLALSPRLSIVLAVAFAAGLGAGGINPPLSAAEYERVPAPLQARVLGVLGAVAWAGIPFGGLAGGALAGALGLRPALLGCGLAYLLATLAPFLFPAWRGMERKSLKDRTVIHFVQ